ncbi:MAG: hypothetical protein ACOX6T_11495 [Myxococcales bacterium]|jgi:hypothetical protein
MCLETKHLDYLERTNEADFREKRISYETYIRFADLIDRCRCCDLCDNGEHGDILGECRIHLLRLFISMKRDAERRLNEKAAAKASSGSSGSGTD